MKLENRRYPSSLAQSAPEDATEDAAKCITALQAGVEAMKFEQSGASESGCRAQVPLQRGGIHHPGRRNVQRSASGRGSTKGFKVSPV